MIFFAYKNDFQEAEVAKMRVHMSRVVILLLFLTLMAPPGLTAVLPREDVPVAVNIPQWVVLEVFPGLLEFEEEDFDFEGATVDDPGVTAQKLEALELRSAGNIPYAISISVPEGLTVFSHLTLDGAIPVGNMGWRETPLSGFDGTFAGLTEQSVVIKSYDKAGMDRLINMDFDLLVNWDNPAGAYTGIVLFTVVPGEPGNNQ